MSLKDELQLLREYDAETGEETLESAENVADIEKARELQEGEHIEAMLRTPGWKLLEARMQAAIAANLDALVELSEPAKIAQAQAVVKVYRGVFTDIEAMVSQARRLREAPVAKTDNV